MNPSIFTLYNYSQFQVFAWVAVFVLPLNAAVNPVLYTLSTIPVVRYGLITFYRTNLTRQQYSSTKQKRNYGMFSVKLRMYWHGGFTLPLLANESFKVYIFKAMQYYN